MLFETLKMALNTRKEGWTAWFLQHFPVRLLSAFHLHISGLCSLSPVLVLDIFAAYFIDVRWL